MHLRTATILSLILLASACTGTQDTETPSLTLEPTFEIFSYAALPAFGYCVDDGEIERITLSWQEDTRLQAQIVLRDRKREDDPNRGPDITRLLSERQSRKLAIQIATTPIVTDRHHGCSGAFVLDESQLDDSTTTHSEVLPDGSVLRQIHFEDDTISSDHRCRIDRFFLDYQEINVGSCTSLPHYTPDDAERLLEMLHRIVP